MSRALRLRKKLKASGLILLIFIVCSVAAHLIEQFLQLRFALSDLVGIILPGARVPVIPTNRILYGDGVPIVVLEAGQERYLVDL